MDHEDDALEQDIGAVVHTFRRTNPGISMKRDGGSLHKMIDRPSHATLQWNICSSLRLYSQLHGTFMAPVFSKAQSLYGRDGSRHLPRIDPQGCRKRPSLLTFTRGGPYEMASHRCLTPFAKLLEL